MGGKGVASEEAKPPASRHPCDLHPTPPIVPRMADTRRALLRKLENVEAFPMIALQALPELRADLDAVEAEALLRARELGASLEDIAEALEITRQGVAYKLKALAGNGVDHEDAHEAEADEAEAHEAEAVEAIQVAEVVELADDAGQADEAADEVVDISEPGPETPEDHPETWWPDPKAREAHSEAREPNIDPRVPHTKA